MKKNIFVFLMVMVLAFAGVVCSSMGVNAVAGAEAVDNFIIRSYGDSIASGELLDGHRNYVSGQSIICQDSYPEVFSRRYLETFGGQAIGHAVSGDKTGDLLEILAPYIEGTAEDIDEFNDTDIITLCIGANNVLLSAIDSMSDFLTGNMTEDQYQAILDEGIEQFKQDFPLILDAFSGKKVAVMTVYNPYKYLTLDDITIDSALSLYEGAIRSVLSTFETKLQRMIEMSMVALQTINDDIRNSASTDIYVVDIWQQFAEFDKEQYLQYINADMSKMTINSTNLSAIMSGNVSAILSQFQTHCDPHPSKDGHEIIAQKHLDTFKYFKLSANGDFADLKDAEDSIKLSITTFEEGNYIFKYQGNGVSWATLTGLKETEVKASTLSKANKAYVEVLLNDELIFTTNTLEYEIVLNTFSISCDDSLMGVKDSGDTITIKLDATSMEGYTFDLIDSNGGTIEVLSKEALNEYAVAVDSILGQGEIYVDVYKNGRHITKTNSLSYDFSLNNFAIEMNKNWDGIYLDATETATVNVIASDYSNYYYKLYKWVGDHVLLVEGENPQFEVTAQMLEGDGSIYLEVYKNGKKLYVSNYIKFSVVINSFRLTCDKEISGVMNKSRTFELLISAQDTKGYTYMLYKKIGETSTFLKESSTTGMRVTAEEIEGEGELFVEVYKGETKVFTSNSVAFNVVIGNFTLVSSVDLQNIEDENAEIVIVVNSGNISNIEFKLLRASADKTIAIQTNKTGRFTMTAKQLTGSGRLYVEVYSAGELVSTTNSLDYNIEFPENEKPSGEENSSGNWVIYISLALAGLTFIVGLVIVIARLKKRNSF